MRIVVQSEKEARFVPWPRSLRKRFCRRFKCLRILGILRGKLGDITTVKVQKKTRDRLTKLGNKSETFDDIINRLVNFYVKNSKQVQGVEQ